ncbi:MAG: SPOR domain-containing protein [Myxococcota bacterium]
MFRVKRNQHGTIDIAVPRWVMVWLPMGWVATLVAAFALGTWWGAPGARWVEAEPVEADFPAVQDPPLDVATSADREAAGVEPDAGGEDSVGFADASTASEAPASAVPAENSSEQDESTEPESTKTESAAPIEWTERVPESGWGVQIGAFPSREEAVAFLRSLSAVREPIFLSTVEIPGRGTFTRLRVGHVDTKQQAERLSREWARRVDEQPLVVGYP